MENNGRGWGRQPLTQNISPAPLWNSIKPQVQGNVRHGREKSSPPSGMNWNGSPSQFSPKRQVIAALNLSPQSQLNNANRMRQMLYYHQQFEIQKQNLSMLKVEGNKSNYGRKHGSVQYGAQSQIGDQKKNLSIGQRQPISGALGKKLGQQPKSKDGVVYTKMEDENNKGRIRVTIESPNFNNLRNDLPSGDKSALNATDNTSRGHLKGIGSRDDSKFQILTGKETAMMETYGNHETGAAELLIDLGILTPTTLADQASPKLIRKSKDGLKGQHEFSFKKVTGYGIEDGLLSQQKLHSDNRMTESNAINQSSVIHPFMSTNINHMLDVTSDNIMQINDKALPSKQLTSDMTQGIHYSSFNPDQSIVRSDLKQNSMQSQPDSVVSRARNNRSTVARSKADTMLSKIVEVQGQLRHGSKRNRKRAGTKLDEQSQSVRTSLQQPNHGTTDKKLLKQLHEQQMLYKMQRQYLENQNMGNSFLVNGQDGQVLKMPENQEEILLYQYIQEMHKLMPIQFSVNKQYQNQVADAQGGIKPQSRGEIAPFRDERSPNNDELDINQHARDLNVMNQKVQLGNESVQVINDNENKPINEEKFESQLGSWNHSSQKGGASQKQSVMEKRSIGKQGAQPQFGLESDLLNTAAPNVKSNLDIRIDVTNSRNDNYAKSVNQYKGVLKSGKSHEQDLLVVHGRGSRADSTASDYKLRQNQHSNLQKPQTADQQNGGRIMQRRTRNQKTGSNLDPSMYSKGSIQQTAFQKQLQQIKSNKVWSNTMGNTLLQNQQQRNVNRLAQQNSSTAATTHIGSYSLTKGYPGASTTGKIKLGTNHKINQRSEKNNSIQVGVPLNRDKGSLQQTLNMQQTIADAHVLSQQINQLKLDQSTLYNRSVLDQNYRKASMQEEQESLMTDLNGQMQQQDALDLPADEAFGPKFKQSILFLEQFDAKDIQQRIYNRDGSLKDRNMPFFMEQLEKEKKIRSTRTHNLRTVGGRIDGKKDICRPIQANYIHNRMTTSQRHYEKCKNRLMTYFTHQMIHQKRAANSQLVNRDRSSYITDQQANLAKETIMTVHTLHNKLGQRTLNQDINQNSKDSVRPAAIQTHKATWACGSSDGELGYASDSQPICNPKMMDQSSMSQPVSIIEHKEEVINKSEDVMAEGYQVVPDGVTAEPGSITQDYPDMIGDQQSNNDPNSAMLNTANLKIDQRMYSDSDKSPLPNTSPKDAIPIPQVSIQDYKEIQDQTN